MSQVIYGDVLFVINFAMDFLSLYLTGSLLSLRRRTLHLVLAASLGALYAVVSVFAGGNELISFAVSAAVSVLMCYTAYGGRRIIGTSAVFIGVSFMLGGSITALYGIINKSRHVLINGEIGTLYSEIPPMWLIILAAVSALISCIWGRLRSKRRRTVEVSVITAGRCAKFEALSDSGNLLREPISGLPVIAVSPDIMRELVPDDIYSPFSECDLSGLAERDLHFARRVRLIPASSVTENALLPAVRCDKIIIDGCERDGLLALGKLPGREAVVPEVLTE